MSPPFQALSLDEFRYLVRDYPWRSAGKSEIHVHHTWRPNHDQYRGEATIHGMWRFHVHKRGWSDIAQHVSIAPDGVIWTGREWNRSPASAAGHNHAGVFMFEMIGDFDRGRDRLEGDQLQAAVGITATLQEFFGLPLWPSIRFHNEMSGKSCPGSAVAKPDFVAAVGAAREDLNAEFATMEERAEVRRPLIASAAREEFQEPRHDADLVEYWGEETDVYNRAASVRGYKATVERLVETRAETPPDAKHPIWIRRLQEADFAVREARREMAAMPPEAAFDLMTDALGRAASNAPDIRGAQALRERGAPERGVSEAFAEIGRRILRRVEKSLHELVCGNEADDEADRKAILAALRLDAKTAVASIVAVLISSFGLSAVIAGYIGALIWDRLVLPAVQTGAEGVCELWGERIGQFD